MTGLIKTVPFEHAFLMDAALGIIATVLLWVLVFKDKKFNRIDGVVFLIIYIVYTIWLIK